MKTTKIRVLWAIVACLLINSQNLKANTFVTENSAMGGFFIIAGIVGGSLMFYFIYSLVSKNEEENKPNKNNMVNSFRNHHRHHQRHIIKKTA